MKITIDRKTFAQALSSVAPFSPIKAPMPILKNTKITTKGNRMKIEANDSQCSMVRYIEVMECDEDGSFLVDTSDLNKFIAKVKSDTIEIIVRENTVQLKHSKGVAEFQTLSAEDYPSFQLLKEDATEVRIPASMLLDAVTKGRGFVSADIMRPQMCAIYAYIKDGVFGYCATDTHKLIHNSVPFDSDLDINWYIVAPIIPSLIANCKNGGDVVVMITDKQVSYRIGSCLIQAIMPTGKFPDFKRVIPQSWTIECAVDKNELLEALGRVNLFCDTSECVKIDVTRMDMTLSVNNLDYMKSSKENLTHNGCDGEIQIGVNASIAMTSASVFDSGEVLMRMTDASRPILFTQKDNEGLQVVAMPMQILS